MRIFIAVFLFFSCCSLSLSQKKAEANVTIKNYAKKLINFSKKPKNFLKTERFSDQTDILHHSIQNHAIIAAHFVKFIPGLGIQMIKTNIYHTLNLEPFYNFIFQYLYPKHSFW